VSLGIAELRAQQLAEKVSTIGAFMQGLREEARRNQSVLQGRLSTQESFQLWTVVIAGNDPESEVRSLTRGAHYSADIDKLLVSTEANVAQDLKRHPERLGLLGASVGARVLHVSFMTALAVVRDFAGDDLRARLAATGVFTEKDGKGAPRLRDSQLGGALRGLPQGLRAPGRPPRDERRQEFERLTAFARSDDGALNETFGLALQASALVRGFRREAPLGDANARHSDLLCETESGSVRLEFMWRSSATSGEIARYVLEKLRNYGKAIGFLNGG
jgi:DNA (cytosine-5)-methyltransferase 1